MQNNQFVSNLKSLISEKANGLPIERLKLVYKGRTMQDASLVGEYNLEEGCKVHLIIQKEFSASETIAPSATNLESKTTSTISDPSTSTNSTSYCQSKTANQSDNKCNIQTKPSSKFEIVLRERLGKHFSPDEVNKIMANLEQEIDADINSSSLDDLERLAKQKLNISNE